MNSIKDVEFTLPEATYFSSRRVAEDFDRQADKSNFIDDCFGFDDGDDDDDEIVTESANKKVTDAITKPENEKGALKEIRAKLKRFLQNPDGESNESNMKDDSRVITANTAKKAKTTAKSPSKGDTSSSKGETSPSKIGESPAKVAKSPARPKRNVVFGDTGPKQKDIRNAFAVIPSDKRKKDNPKDGVVADLFTEVETVRIISFFFKWGFPLNNSFLIQRQIYFQVQDRRRSYSRPQRHRKRRMSIDSEESEVEQIDDEDYEENGKKRAKRRKKTAQPNPKVWFFII